MVGLDYQASLKPEAQEEIDAGKALLYRIPARDLQSE